MTEDLKEKTADESDRATAIEMAVTEEAVLSVRRLAKQAQSPLPDGSYRVTECEECGGDIGAGRLKVAAMNLLCIHCATELEGRNRGFRR